MDRGQVGLATLEANTNSLGYRFNGAQGEAWCNLYNDCTDLLAKQRPDRFIGMAVVPAARRRARGESIGTRHRRS